MLNWIYLGAIAALIVWTAMKGGPRQALWLCWPVGIYLGTTRRFITNVELLGTIDNQYVTVLVLGLALLSGGPSGPYPALRWSACDFILLFMYICFNLTLQVNGQYGPKISIAYAMSYLVPYLLGRIYLRSERDLPGALRPLSVVLMAFVVAIVFQSLTSISLMDLLAGMPGKLTGTRNGFYRAVGGMSHPDGAGLLLLISYPMAVAASRLAQARVGPRWWKGLPWAVAIGTLSTNARGAWLGMLVALGVHLFCVRRVLRMPIAAVGCLVLSVLLFAPDFTKTLLYTIGDDAPGSAAYSGEVRIVVIDGIEYVYTGTDHRWLLSKVYAPALRAAGYFGFGNIAGESLIEESHRFYFWSIDNYYIMLQVVFGLIGLWSFLLLAAFVSFGLVRAAWSQRNPIIDPMASAMLAATIAVVVLLRSVCLLNDMQKPWFFTLGLGVSLGQICRRPGLVPPVSTRPPINRSSPPNAQGWSGGWRPAGQARIRHFRNVTFCGVMLILTEVKR